MRGWRRNAIVLAVAMLSVTASLGAAAYLLHPTTSAPEVSSRGPAASAPAPRESIGASSLRAGARNAPEPTPGRAAAASPAATQWSVANTLVVLNNTLVSGNFVTPLEGDGAAATSLAFDNRSDELYVADFDNAVEVVSDTTDRVVDIFAPIASVEYITSIAYDYKNNEIFTQYTGDPGTVVVTSAATNTLVGTISIGDVTEYNLNGLAYDSGLGEVFASNAESGNVSVINATTNRLVGSVSLPGQLPEALAYDAATHQVFAADDYPVYDESNVSVISDATNSLVTSVNVGESPDALAYDSAKGEVFVANWGSSNVSVIDDSTDTVTATIPVLPGPSAEAYDPAKNEVFVTSGLNVSVVSDVSNSVVATVPFGHGVYSAAYDPSVAELWVLDGDPTNATAISDASNTVVVNVLLSFMSRYWAYDSAHQEEFLADEDSATVAVVSDVTDHVVAWISIPGEYPSPYQLVYDRGKGEVFVANDAGVGSLSVINDTTNSVVDTIPLPGVIPTGMAYDSAKGEIFVGNEGGGNNVTIVSDATNSIVGVVAGVGTDPFSLTYDSGKGEVFVANLYAPDLLSNVTVINDTTDSIVAWIQTGSGPEGGMVYDPATGEIFDPNYQSYNVSVISDATNTVVKTIYTGTFPWGAAYDAAADEVFVGNFNDGDENITIISDLTDTTVGSIGPVGEEPSALAFDPVTGDLYAGDSSDDTVAVITPGSGPAANHYSVTFTESGLPAGTSWGVTFNATLSSSTTDSIMYSVLDGDYSYTVAAVTGYSPLPESGPVTVSGSSQTIPIVFTASSSAPTYPVTFTESGLPSGTSWSVTFDSIENSSTTTTIGFRAVDGSYSFQVGAVSGYTPAPGSGPLVVNAGPASQAITFTAGSTPPPSSSGPTFLGLPGVEGWAVLGAILAALIIILLVAFASRRHRQPIVFRESGLPDGTAWTVALDGESKSSQGPEIGFEVHGGTHAYQVRSPGGFRPSPAAGNVEVKRDRVDVPIRFDPSRPNN